MSILEHILSAVTRKKYYFIVFMADEQICNAVMKSHGTIRVRDTEDFLEGRTGKKHVVLLSFARISRKEYRRSLAHDNV